MHLPWPLQPFFFVQDFLGGLYAAIGMLFYWIMPYSHSHSLLVLWDFLGGLYAAIGMLFYWIIPYSHSHSHITLAWFASSPLHPPSHSLTHSTPTGLPVLCSHEVLRASTHDFGLVCFVPSPPTTCFLTLPQQVSSTFHGLLAVWVIP